MGQYLGGFGDAGIFNRVFLDVFNIESSIEDIGLGIFLCVLRRFCRLRWGSLRVTVTHKQTNEYSQGQEKTKLFHLIFRLLPLLLI